LGLQRKRAVFRLAMSQQTMQALHKDTLPETLPGIFEKNLP
jgi:hypothetical protein